MLSHLDGLINHFGEADPEREETADLYKRMRRAVGVFPWDHVVTDVVRSDGATAAARSVRVRLDAITTFGFSLRHPCRGLDWRPDPSGQLDPTGAVAVGRVSDPWSRVAPGGGSRRPEGGAAASAGPSRGGVGRGRSSPGSSPHRSPSGGGWDSSPDDEADGPWASEAARNAAVALLGSQPVEEVDRMRVPPGAAVAAMASAWFGQVASLRRAVTAADGRPYREALRLVGQAVGRATDAGVALDSFKSALEAIPLVGESALRPERFNASEILGRRPFGDGGTEPPRSQRQRSDSVGRRRRDSSEEE